MSGKIPTLATSHFLPGLGSDQQHVVGAAGVGINVITATLAANTAQTCAELIAGPPNTATVNACGPVVHSLGRAPSVVWAQQLGIPAAATGMGAIVAYQYVTANNSAVYMFAKTWSGAVPLGVGTQFYIIP